MVALKDTFDESAPGRDPDVALMLRVQQDDASALHQLLDLYWCRLFGRFFRQLGDRQEAEDLVQDVFLRLFRNRKRYRPQAKFATWLFHIANNVARNAIRNRGRRPNSVRCIFDEELPIHNGACSPTDRLERAEIAGAVREAMALLKDRQRRAVELQCQDRSYSEIGDELDMTAKAAKSLLYRARNELRLTLSPLAEAVG